MSRRIFAPVLVATGTLVCMFLCLQFSQAQTTLDSTACNQLYGLPAGTIATAISQQYLNSTVCGAMQDLISRYNPGNCSSVGFSNAKVQGITSLNSTFAVNLDNMLKAADAAGYHITINSAYRSATGEQCANPAAARNGFVSMHSKGLAADLQYPSNGAVTTECDGTAPNPGAAYQWVNAHAATYNLGQYDQIYSHLNGECNHVEERSGTSNGTLGPGATNTGPANPIQAITNALGITNSGQGCPTGYVMTNGTCSPQSPSGIYSTPGLGSGSPAGQIATQDTYCVVSTNPPIIEPVPAGTVYPSNCISGAQTTCPAGYTSSNGTCIQQSCPAGYTLVNGFCSQTQQPVAAQQAASTVSNPAPAGTATTPTTAPAQQQSSGTSNSTPTTPATSIASPNLLSNTGGASLIAALNALANPQPATTTATTAPITLSGAAQDITQLEASPFPGVTYAVPTSALFPANNASDGSTTTTDNGNGITTTAGSGYGDEDGTGNGTTLSSGTVSSIADTRAPAADTFGSNDAAEAPASASFTGAPSTFSNNLLSILGALKIDVIGMLNILAPYAQPFGGVIPNQSAGE